MYSVIFKTIVLLSFLKCFNAQSVVATGAAASSGSFSGEEKDVEMISLPPPGSTTPKVTPIVPLSMAQKDNSSKSNSSEPEGSETPTPPPFPLFPFAPLPYFGFPPAFPPRPFSPFGFQPQFSPFGFPPPFDYNAYNKQLQNLIKQNQILAQQAAAAQRQPGSPGFPPNLFYNSAQSSFGPDGGFAQTFSFPPKNGAPVMKYQTFNPPPPGVNSFGVSSFSSSSFNDNNGDQSGEQFSQVSINDNGNITTIVSSDPNTPLRLGNVVSAPADNYLNNNVAYANGYNNNYNENNNNNYYPNNYYKSLQ